MRKLIVAIALACSIPNVGLSEESSRRPFARDQNRQKVLSEASRLGSEVEVRYEDSVRSLTAKRKERERENMKRNNSEESDSRSSFSFRRGAERIGGNTRGSTRSR
jgi:hypothetical protein